MTLKNILGNIPVIRVLDFLIDHQGYDLTKKDIAEGAEIGATAMKEGFKCLEQCDIVIETRKIEGVSLYALDTESEMTQSLIEFDEALTDYCTDRILETEPPLDEECGEPLPEPPED